MLHDRSICCDPLDGTAIPRFLFFCFEDGTTGMVSRRSYTIRQLKLNHTLGLSCLLIRILGFQLIYVSNQTLSPIHHEQRLGFSWFIEVCL